MIEELRRPLAESVWLQSPSRLKWYRSYRMGWRDPIMFADCPYSTNSLDYELWNRGRNDVSSNSMNITVRFRYDQVPNFLSFEVPTPSPSVPSRMARVRAGITTVLRFGMSVSGI